MSKQLCGALLPAALKHKKGYGVECREGIMEVRVQLELNLVRDVKIASVSSST